MWLRRIYCGMSGYEAEAAWRVSIHAEWRNTTLCWKMQLNWQLATGNWQLADSTILDDAKAEGDLFWCWTMHSMLPLGFDSHSGDSFQHSERLA